MLSSPCTLSLPLLFLHQDARLPEEGPYQMLSLGFSNSQNRKQNKPLFFIPCIEYFVLVHKAIADTEYDDTFTSWWYSVVNGNCGGDVHGSPTSSS